MIQPDEMGSQHGALTGHVTEEMQRHYSTVGLDEKRAAIAGVLRLVPPEPRPVATGAGGTNAGTKFGPTAEAGRGDDEVRFPDEKRCELPSQFGPTSKRLVPSFEPRRWDQRWDHAPEFGRKAL